MKNKLSVLGLDASEPENQHGSPKNSSWAAGSFQRTGMMFPWYHAKAYHEGLIAAGASDGVLLSRSAWAGVSKFGAAVWNGDTESKWSFLSAAIRSGLNIQLSGIAWWTTDIGGYANGKPADPDFRELVVRWFQSASLLFLPERWRVGSCPIIQLVSEILLTRYFLYVQLYLTFLFEHITVYFYARRVLRRQGTASFSPSREKMFW